jgi:hypothetical protein
MPNVQSTGLSPGAEYPLGSGRIDAYSALAFYGARRFVTPYHAYLDMMRSEGVDLPGDWLRVCVGSGTECLTWEGGRTSGYYTTPWSSRPHTDREYLESLSHVRLADRPEDLEQCVVPQWAQYLFGSLVQMGPAAALVQRDITETVAAVAAEAEIARLMVQAVYGEVADVRAGDVRAGFAQLQAERREYEAARTVTNQAAQYRRDLIRMRRSADMATTAINGSLLAGGVGALAGWAVSGILGGKK